MLVTADTQHQRARFVVFGERLGSGFALGLGGLLRLLLLLLFRRDGDGIFT